MCGILEMTISISSHDADSRSRRTSTLYMWSDTQKGPGGYLQGEQNLSSIEIQSHQWHFVNHFKNYCWKCLENYWEFGIHF